MARPPLTALLLLFVACTSSTSSPAPVPPSVPERGGIVRVAVWDEPDPGAATLGGAGVRALVLPQLFTAQPHGAWAPSLVRPQSDQIGEDRRSASFLLREGAVWSDGTPITADDLRRSADVRLVAGVDGPAADGRITVRFTQPLPGWRRLWSGLDSVSPPRPEVWGGPFVVAGRTSGLETVLRRNERWYGGHGPFLDEVRLVLVPDPVTARQLLARGEVDVVMPPPATARTAQLRAVEGVEVAVAARSGWWTGLWLQPDRLSVERRRAVVTTVARRRFVETLLRDEATVPDDAADPSAPGGGVGTIDLVGMPEEPMTGVLQRSMQKRARSVDGRLELRNAEADRVQGWLAEGSYDAAVVPAYDSPGVCRPCEASADEAVLLPLWRWKVVVAWRAERVAGVVVNGWALNAAWNAAAWHLP